MNSVSSPNNTVHDESKPHYVKNEKQRWDLMILWYYLCLHNVTMSFGGSVDSEYNRVIHFFAYLHFITENIRAFHFIFSKKVAKRLSIFVTIGWSIPALLFTCNPFVTYHFQETVFLCSFLLSDAYNVACSMVLLLNTTYYPGSHNMRKIAFGSTIHFMGVFISLIQHHVATFWIYNNHLKGLSWTLVGLTPIIGIYFSKNGLNSSMNWLDSDMIKWTSNCDNGRILTSCGYSIKYQTFIQLVTFLFSVGVFFEITLTHTYARTTDFGEDNNKFALWIWDDIILALGLPLGIVLDMIVILIWVQGRMKRNEWIDKQKGYDKKMDGDDNYKDGSNRNRSDNLKIVGQVYTVTDDYSTKQGQHGGYSTDGDSDIRGRENNNSDNNDTGNNNNNYNSENGRTDIDAFDSQVNHVMPVMTVKRSTPLQIDVRSRSTSQKSQSLESVKDLVGIVVNN